MKKLIAVFFSLLLLTALASCDNKDSDVPEGMQLVYGSDIDGYYFYAPEGWIVSNIGEIKSAYVSKINTTSVSFAEVNFETAGDKSEYFFNHYFYTYISDLEKMTNFHLDPESIKDTTFGIGENAANRAKRYVYSYEYKGLPFTFMQILVERDQHFYIFTYAAQSTAKEGEVPNYQKHYEDALSVIDNFKFVKRLETAPMPPVEYQRDQDGYILVSDKKLSGFELYVPDSFTPSYSSAIVSATHEDGSSVTLVKASAIGGSADDYWNTRLQELTDLFGEINVIKSSYDTELGNSDSFFGGNWDWAYEYTYWHEGKLHHVYQILSINGMKGYVFTYTALEENYATHKPEIDKIIEKVRF